MDRKTTASHARHWHCFYIHLMDAIFLERPQGHVFNSSTSLVPVDVLLKAYLNVPSLPLYSSCSTINNLASSLNDDAVIALFADDVSILTTARKKEDVVEAAAQSVVNSVVIWSHEWKLNFNADKRDVCHFSTLSNDTSLVLRKFGSTPLLVFSALFWTEA